MVKSNAVTIIGSIKDKIVRSKGFKTIDEAKSYVDGYKLDTIGIECRLYTTDDVDSLITLLKIARESLHTQGVNHGSNFTQP